MSVFLLDYLWIDHMVVMDYGLMIVWCVECGEENNLKQLKDHLYVIMGAT
jgi:hypothetical protein